MNHQHAPASLRIAITFGAFIAPLAKLLAKHRTEEPGTEIHLIETTFSEQAQGLEGGHYDLAFAVEPTTKATLHAEMLWRDEIAIALPERSPLLEFAEIPLQKAAQYPLVLWSAEHCESFYQHVQELLASANTTLNIVDYVKSFELMAVLVAAGYGIGFAGKSRIAAARSLGVVMRPLSGPRKNLNIYLLRAHATPTLPARRLIERAHSLDQAVTIE